METTKELIKTISFLTIVKESPFYLTKGKIIKAEPEEPHTDIDGHFIDFMLLDAKTLKLIGRSSFLDGTLTLTNFTIDILIKEFNETRMLPSIVYGTKDNTFFDLLAIGPNSITPEASKDPLAKIEALVNGLQNLITKFKGNNNF